MREPGSPSVIESGALFSFLTYLRGTGYLIGPQQYVLAHDLLAAIVSRSGHAEQEMFLAALCPVVAKSPREQAEFRSRFDTWKGLANGHAVKAVAPTHDHSSELDKELRSVTKGALIAALVLVLLGAIAGTYFWWTRPAPKSAPAPTTSGGNIESGPAQSSRPVDAAQTAQATIKANSAVVWSLSAECGVFATILATAWFVWWRLRARRFLARHTVTATPDLTTIQVEADTTELLPEQTVQLLGRALRRRVPVVSNDLAIYETVRRTTASGGEFTPVYGFRQVMPEYLMLVDRYGHLDENARFASELSERLDRGDRLVTVFYFSKDPAIVFPSEKAWHPIRMDEIKTRFQNHRLIVFADAASITNGTVEQVRTWLSPFGFWSERFWVTPFALEGRLPQERVLMEYFRVFPAATEGLDELGRDLENGRHESFRSTESVPLEPRQLQIRPDRWIRRNPAPENETDELMISLRTYLGEAGFDWLAACAVYPEIHSNLITYIGKRLPGRDGTPIYNASLYLRLTNLIWFREGWMPEWIRQKLIDELTPRRVDEIRTLLEGVLLTSLRGEISGLELKVAQKHPEAVSRLVRNMLPRLSKGASSESPMADVVFVSFLGGRRSISLPRVVFNLIRTGVANGKVRNLELVPDGLRRFCRVCLFLLGTILVAGIAMVLLDQVPQLDSAYGTVLLFVGVGGGCLSEVLGCVFLWLAWRISSRPVLTAGVLALLVAPIGAGLIAIGSQSPTLLWLAAGMGMSPILVLCSAWRSCRYTTPESTSPGRTPIWSYAGLALASGAAVLDIIACWLALAYSDPGLVFKVLVWAGFVMAMIGGPMLVFTAIRQRLGALFLVGAILLGVYSFGELAIFAAGVTSLGTPAASWLMAGYGVFGLVACFRAWRASRPKRDTLLASG